MAQPENVGRYRIVGHLASGGMADIFLGKLLGPSGFERPVVLKRILPKLASREHVQQMFLDEARLAARINHANVVHVQELVEQDGGFYLVMEYLEGENTLSLMKRAARRRERVPPAIAAHVIAEACAGIHAAHELTSETGEPLNLVHRDLSPGNVFVTYAGGVKVLDFGIAKFKAKTTETQVGKVRGKFAYMSPEQCRGKPIDRRSDVFSLGTVLFELSTGRRLFARETHRLTMKAVTQAKLPPMERIDRTYPKELLAVIEKALSVDPDDRYATAARMRRELVAFVQSQAQEELPEERLASLMQRWFPMRIDEKRRLLTAVRSGTKVTRIPSAEVDAAVELPDADTVVTPKLHHQSTVETPGFAPTAPDTPGLPAPARAPLTPSAASAILQSTPPVPHRAASEPPPPAPREGSPRALWLGVAAIVLVGIGVGVGLLVGASQSEERDAVSLPTLDTDRATPEAAAPAPRSVPVPSEQTASPMETVTFDLNYTPNGSQILVDGQYRGLTPSSVAIPRGDEPVRIEIVRGGYRTQVGEYVPDQNRTIGGALVRIRRPGRRSRRSGRARPPDPSPTPPPSNDDPFERYDE